MLITMVRMVVHIPAYFVLVIIIVIVINVSVLYVKKESETYELG